MNYNWRLKKHCPSKVECRWSLPDLSWRTRSIANSVHLVQQISVAVLTPWWRMSRMWMQVLNILVRRIDKAELVHRHRHNQPRWLKATLHQALEVIKRWAGTSISKWNSKVPARTILSSRQGAPSYKNRSNRRINKLKRKSQVRVQALPRWSVWIR